jgi:hypothetical protein
MTRLPAAPANCPWPRRAMSRGSSLGERQQAIPYVANGGPSVEGGLPGVARARPAQARPPARDARLLDRRDPRRLPLPPVLRFALCQPEQDARDHPADCPAQVDLLGHGHHADPAVATLGEQIHPITLSAGDAVQLPGHDHLDPPGEDAPLQPIERRAIQGPPGLLALEPLGRGRIDPIAEEPALDQRPGKYSGPAVRSWSFFMMIFVIAAPPTVRDDMSRCPWPSRRRASHGAFNEAAGDPSGDAIMSHFTSCMTMPGLDTSP